MDTASRLFDLCNKLHGLPARIMQLSLRNQVPGTSSSVLGIILSPKKGNTFVQPKTLAGEQEAFYCNADQFPWFPALKIFATEPE